MRRRFNDLIAFAQQFKTILQWLTTENVTHAALYKRRYSITPHGLNRQLLASQTDVLPLHYRPASYHYSTDRRLTIAPQTDTLITMTPQPTIPSQTDALILRHCGGEQNCSSLFKSFLDEYINNFPFFRIIWKYVPMYLESVKKISANIH